MNWTRTKLKHLCVDAGQYGLNISAQEYTPSGHRLIRTSDIDENGRLRSREGAVFVDIPLDAHHKLKDGDLLLSRSGTVGRALLLDALEESSTYAGYLIRFRPRPGTEPRFMAYVAASCEFQAAIEANAVTSTIQNFNAERYANINVTLPTIDEQRHIADFLDGETARIDGLAAARQRMRDLLVLKRERMVEQILGLDAGPTMVPLKYEVQSVSVGIVITPANWYVDSGGVTALRGLNVRSGHIDTSDIVQISHAGHRENMKSRLSAGDVVVVRTGQAGTAAVVPDALDGCNCIDLLIIRPGRSTSSSFLSHYLNSFYARDKITEYSVGSIQSHFNVGSMKNLGFPLLELKEQERRASALDEVAGDLDLLDLQLETQLALLGERRQALITAAVTGQIDVTTSRGLDSDGGNTV